MNTWIRLSLNLIPLLLQLANSIIKLYLSHHGY